MYSCALAITTNAQRIGVMYTYDEVDASRVYHLSAAPSQSAFHAAVTRRAVRCLWSGLHLVGASLVATHHARPIDEPVSRTPEVRWAMLTLWIVLCVTLSFGKLGPCRTRGPRSISAAGAANNVVMSMAQTKLTLEGGPNVQCWADYAGEPMRLEASVQRLARCVMVADT